MSKVNHFQDEALCPSPAPLNAIPKARGRGVVRVRGAVEGIGWRGPAGVSAACCVVAWRCHWRLGSGCNAPPGGGRPDVTPREESSMKCVFILGAGASREGGGPLMGDFLDKADELRRLQAEGVQEAGTSFDNVFSAISELQGVYSKSYLDLDNIEVLFGAIEMGVLLEKLGNRDSAEIEILHNDVITLIYKTLESCIQFPASEKRISPPKPYGAFSEILRDPRDQVRRGPPLQLGFITFNYDLALDFALHWNNIRYGYGLPGQLSQDVVPLLKLHGSINWGMCTKCQEIVPYPVGKAHFTLWPDIEYVRYNLGSTLPSRKHCETPLPLPPVIVPPTWNKTAYHGQLSSVWRHAARVLSEAENVFVIGYSLSETDSFFRYLFALGSESKARIKRFWVFDPDPTESVERRFREMIGRGIENRFQFHRLKFSDAIPLIGEALRGA